MSKLLKLWLALMCLCLPAVSHAAKQNLILITIDGLRWQEMFRGPSQALLEDKTFTKRSEQLVNALANSEGKFSAADLMPFFHERVASEGVLYGNADKGECIQVTNPWFFSYPGYNEILTGVPDPAIDSNDKVANKNVTFLEFLNQQKGFAGRVQAFASWDAFPFIINSERSGVPVNAGFAPASGKLNQQQIWLNQLLADTPSPWDTVRLDAFTYHYARQALAQDKPRVMYIAFGETDDFAHDGEYDQYLLAAHRTDRFIAELWQWLQSNRFYRNRTTLIVTTDHGRGEMPLESWQHHGSRGAVAKYNKLDEYPDGIVGSEQVWFAAMGPDISADRLASPTGKCFGSHQFAATGLQALGEDWQRFNPAAGQPLFQNRSEK